MINFSKEKWSRLSKVHLMPCRIFVLLLGIKSFSHKGGVVADEKPIIERRKHKRFTVRAGASVTFVPYFSKQGQIVDISEGGLAFRYISGGKGPWRGFIAILIDRIDLFATFQVVLAHNGTTRIVDIDNTGLFHYQVMRVFEVFVLNDDGAFA